MGTEISYWLRLNGTFDKREMLLEAICKIFLTEQLHMDEKLFRSIYFSTMPRLMQERYVLFIYVSSKLNSLWQSTSERRKQQTSADFAGDLNPST